MHPPAIIFVMLGVLALMSSLLAGYAMAGGKTRSWIHVVGFALIMATTVYVILDLEFPRLGIIRIDAFDQVFVDLRQSMQ
jgi:flagellar motor component MotA